METNSFNLTSSKKNEYIPQNYISLNQKSVKQRNFILQIKSAINPFLKPIYSTNKKLSNNNENIFKNNFLIPNINNPLSSTSKTNNNNSFSYLNKTIKKESLPKSPKFFTESKSIPEKQNIFINSSEIKLDKISFLNKKRKHMTSEELEIEQIKKEKEESKKLLEKNKKFYYKSLTFTPMKITPTPLTTFKPFNLSCNKKNKFIKEGKCCSLYETNKLNQKIRLKMQQKIEALNDIKIKNEILLNNTEYLRRQNILYNDLFKEPKNIVKEENNKENVDKNKDINCLKNYFTPKKKENCTLMLNTKNKQFNQSNFFTKSKIINYYLSNIKKNNNE